MLTISPVILTVRLIFHAQLARFPRRVSESLLSDGDVLGIDTDERNYRSVYSGHNILSAYLSSMVQEESVETGWVTDNRYVIPLHVPSVVVGHVHKHSCLRYWHYKGCHSCLCGL